MTGCAVAGVLYIQVDGWERLCSGVAGLLRSDAKAANEESIYPKGVVKFELLVTGSTGAEAGLLNGSGCADMSFSAGDLLCGSLLPASGAKECLCDGAMTQREA